MMLVPDAVTLDPAVTVHRIEISPSNRIIVTTKASDGALEFNHWRDAFDYVNLFNKYSEEFETISPPLLPFKKK